MEDKRELQQAEKLSCVLDDTASDCRPDCEDIEIEQLMDVAVIVKQAYSEQADIPVDLIADMSDQLSRELKAQKPKNRRLLFFGSVLGTAAAVCIAAFIHFMPATSTDRQIALQTPVETEQQHLAPAVQQQNLYDETPNRSLRQDPSPEMAPETDREKNSTAAGVSETQQEAGVRKRKQSAADTGSTEQEFASTASMIQAKRARVQSEPQQQDTTLTRQQAMAVLVIPNLEARSVIIDPGGEVIQQVYNTGKDAVTITQRVRHQEAGGQGDGMNQPEQPLVKAATKKINSITVVVDNYDITVEGEKPVEELRKIAQSLVIKK